jgi:predicted amidohydrolase
MGVIAVVQLNAGSDRGVNLALVDRMVSEAAAKGAALVCLPECFDYITSSDDPDDRWEHYEPLNGPLMLSYCALAAKHGVWLSLGGYHELISHERLSNTHVIVNAKGAIVASYRKAHLFDVCIADGSFRESDGTEAGKGLVVVKGTPVGSLGLATCYDVRFPGLFTALRDRGADVLLVPSAFMPGTGQAHWEPLLRARAIENQCYVVAASQTGTHGVSRASHGHSLIVDPWGSVLVDLQHEPDTVGVVPVKHDAIADIRTSMPIWSHRRDDLYPGLDRAVVSVVDVSCDVTVVRSLQMTAD